MWNPKKMVQMRDFPGGPVVKNLPSNVGDTGSNPGQGTKIPHAAGQLSPCTATTEPAHHNWREARPHATTKSPRTATKGPTCHNEDPTCRN